MPKRYEQVDRRLEDGAVTEAAIHHRLLNETLQPDVCMMDIHTSRFGTMLKHDRSDRLFTELDDECVLATPWPASWQPRQRCRSLPISEPCVEMPIGAAVDAGTSASARLQTP